VFIIVTLCYYSDTSRNAFSVVSGRKIFTSGENTFRRENGKLVLNKVELNRMVDTTVNTAAGGVAFYDGIANTPAELEARQWIEAIVNDTDPCVLPQQAYVVSQILEAIYESSKTGKPVFFE